MSNIVHDGSQLILSYVAQYELSPAQCRAARALLGWSQSDLEIRAKVARKTLADFESGKRRPYERTLRDIREAFEAAGISFVGDGEVSEGGGAGVRLPQILID